MKTSNPISVYIPTYNRSKYLRCQINAVLNQTFYNFDLFVVDNASDDDTSLVVKEFNDPRLHYIKHRIHLTAVDNFNYIIDNCSTKYIAIFHDDDIVHNNILEEEYKYFCNDENIKAVTSNCDIINSYGNKILVYGKDKSFSEYFKDSYIINYIKDFKSLSFPTALYDANFLKKNNIKFKKEAGPSCDVVFFADIEKNGGTLLELSYSLYDIREHELQDSHINYLIMKIMLFEYLNNDVYYHNIMKKFIKRQKIIFSFLSLTIISSLFQNKINLYTCEEYIHRLSKCLKHNLLDLLFFYVFAYIISFTPHIIKKIILKIMKR